MNIGKAISGKASKVWFVIVILSLVVAREVSTLEEDAQLLTPIASLAKSIVKTITLGAALEFGPVNTTELTKSFLSFVWRTGFPVSMPPNFLNDAQEFYNGIKDRVYAADVEEMDRLTLANLKITLDDIVDSIVDEVRESPDGLYTDYKKTMVGNLTLDEACYQAGLQLKAYKIDIANYRNIAGAVLGVPLMPQVASTVIAGASLVPDLGIAKDATNKLIQSPVGKIPGSAINAMANTVDMVNSNFPIPDALKINRQNGLIPQIAISPLSFFGSRRSSATSSASGQTSTELSLAGQPEDMV